MFDSDVQLETNTRRKNSVRRPMVDLFAGCGGLSLGFEQAGFTPVFVNELNEDARKTYLVNREHLVGGKPFNSMASKLSSSDVNKLDAERLSVLQSDLQALDADLGFGKNGTIDVLAGGPPCQGYSGIGHRRSYSVDKADLPSNRLYERMAFVIEQVRPRIFLFENVRGLLYSKWTSAGEKGEIWKEVYGRFRKLGEEHGYAVRWQMVYARDYGVPQNRPRVLIVGIRNDIVDAVGPMLDTASLAGEQAQGNACDCNFLPRTGLYDVPNLEDLLSDLEDEAVKVALLNQEFPKPFATASYVRRAESKVQKLLRPGALAKKGAQLTDQEYSRHASRIVAKFQEMIDRGGVIPEEYRTKKFAQKLLPRRWDDKPASITATSLPDDYVHYSQPRSLTVREWARLQTFPDWYKFEGKRTTGGLRRAGNPREGLHDREVPKYTQIGNAVPVWLAQAVASHFDDILNAAGIRTGH